MEAMKISEACSKEAFRFHFNHVQVKRTADGAVAYATDGRFLVSAPVTLDESDNLPEGEARLIPRDAWKAAEKVGKASLNGGIKVGQTVTSFLADGKFPDVDPILPKGELSTYRPDDGQYVVRLGTEVLEKLVKVLKANRMDGVTLHFSRVGGNDNPAAFREGELTGVLMPMSGY